jgi:hypothetical protein
MNDDHELLIFDGDLNATKVAPRWTSFMASKSMNENFSATYAQLFSVADVRAGVKLTVKVATWRASIGRQQLVKKS